MFRKIVKQGNQAYTLTLPVDWIKSNGLGFGDYVDLECDNQTIIISTSKNTNSLECEIDLVGLSRAEIFQSLISRYVSGFDKIVCIHSDSNSILDVSGEFTAMILEEHTSSRSIFSSVVLKDSLDIDILIRKLGFFLKNMSSNLILVGTGEMTINSFNSVEKVMDKNILYILRVLNKYSNVKYSYNNFLLVYVFDMIGDLLSEISENIFDDVELSILISKYVDIYVDTIFSNENSTLVSDLRNFRNSIKKNSFVSGLAYSLAEVMYNFVGVLMNKK